MGYLVLLILYINLVLEILICFLNMGVFVYNVVSLISFIIV